MPLPKPKKGEPRQKFMSRCLRDPTTKKDFPDIRKRFAVCSTQFRRK